MYYSPMLQDADSIRRTSRAIRRLPRSGRAASEPGRAGTFWLALVAAARRGADRLVEARLAQARAQVEQTSASLRTTNPRPSRGDVGVRYY